MESSSASQGEMTSDFLKVGERESQEWKDGLVTLLGMIF